MHTGYGIRSSGSQYLLSFIVLIFIIVGITGMIGIGRANLQVADMGVYGEQGTILVPMEEAFSTIAKQAEPVVISITSLQQTGYKSSLSQWPENNPLKDIPPISLMNHPGYKMHNSLNSLLYNTLVKASGSGVIVRRDGDNFYALTNYHVVEGAYSVNVRLASGIDLKGIVVGLDQVTDLAVVRISSPSLSDENIAIMGDSDNVKVGAWALAVGSPYGFEHTLTVGVISALHRELEEEDAIYPDLIQTDAAINKGNSGGPLLDIEGRVIGINSAIASPTGGSIGLGFAIPINTAKEVLDELIRDGRVVRGWIGMSIQEMTPVFREFYGVEKGVLVASVGNKGPASQAGIKSEDVIVRFGSEDIADVRQLQTLVSDASPGDVISIILIRKHRRQTVSVIIGLSPLTQENPPAPAPSPPEAGITVRTLTERLAREIGLRNTTGAIVVKVNAGSTAEEAGLEEGDIIIRFNGSVIGSAEEFELMMGRIRSGEIVMLKIIRKLQTRMIGFRFG